MNSIASGSDTEPDVATDAGEEPGDATNNLSELMSGAMESPRQGNGHVEGDEDDFKTDWIDTLLIPSALVHDRLLLFPTRTDIAGPTHRWKGIDWNILFVLKQREVGCFVGYNYPRQLPPGRSLNLRFQCQFLDANEKVVHEDIPISHEFEGDPLQLDRVDHGHHSAFPLDSFKRYCAAMPHVTVQQGTSPASSALSSPIPSPLRSSAAHFVPVRVRVLMETAFKPAVTPISWNSKAETSMVGLENLGATCYLNALLQMLFHINSFRRAVYSLPHADEHIATSTTLALQSVFRNLQQSEREVTTKELTVAFGWTSAEAFLQQDVQEMMRVLVDKLEEKMKDTVMDGFIKRLFAGTVRSYIRCVNVNYESKRQEEFYDIQLDVKGCKDIYESFRKYTTVEMLDSENQYEAGEFGKQDAQKGVIFESFPPVLTIHLKRFDFDLQSMGFTKIHDYYEFPLRLEVDEFLAPDCPAEARTAPNVYILHSVLVHQGDVGGGHYYAYIRPTSRGFRYGAEEPLESFLANADAELKAYANGGATNDNATGKEQQWFKFNDEIVLPVSKREAVDYCYGRRIRESEFFKSMSSAYMLVYIRESEAADIMREVTVADIPEDLDARLDAELNQRLAAEKRAERMKLYTVAHYATELNVASFKEYSRAQDLLCDRSFTKLQALKETGKLFILIYIAQQLGCMPFDIRLWEVEKMMNSAYRLTDEIDGADLEQRMKTNRFYVEAVESPIAPEDRANIEERYLELLEEEQSFLERLREDLRGCPELFYAEDEDPVLGCGIGSNNRPMYQLKDLHPEKFKKYFDEIKEITSNMVELVETHYQDFPVKEETLVFVKFFDPYDLLPELSQESDGSLESLSSDEEDEGDESGAQGDGIEEASDEAVSSLAQVMDVEGAGAAKDPAGAVPSALGQKRRRPLKTCATREYMPMKFAGALLLPRALRLSQVAAIALRQRRAQLGGALDEWLGTVQQFQYYISAGPTDLNKISPRDVITGVTLNKLWDEEDCAAFLLYVDILPTQPAVLRVPYELTNTQEWLSYVAYKKALLIRPFDQHDVEVLLRRQRMHQELAACQAAEDAILRSSTALSPAGTPISPAQAGLLASPNKHKRVRPEFLRERAGSTSSLRDRSSSIGSVGSDILGMSPFRPPVAKNRKAHVGKSFTIEVALIFKVSYFFRRLAEELSVNPAYLALYFVPMGMRDWEDKKFYVSPMTYIHSNFTLVECLKLFKVNTKMSSKLCVFYRILPFSLLSEDKRHDVRGQNKIADFIIADARVRAWRRMYLEHLKSQPAASALRSGASTPAGAHRSRANSEVGSTGVRVDWPLQVATDYDPLEETCVSMYAPRGTKIGDCIDMLREIIGIPRNIAALEALKHTDAADSDASSAVASLFRDMPGLASLLSSGDAAVCSDALSVDAQGAVRPPYPLLVYNIRERTAIDILGSDRPIKDLVSCVSEANELRGNLYKVGVQYASLEDMIFLKSGHGTIRSIPVTVINFTLNGKYADPCDPQDLPVGGPFVSYVREDDDYQAILRRFTALTGDKEDAHKLRLAVIESRIPHFVPRPRSTLPQAQSVPSVAAMVADTADQDMQATQPLDTGDLEGSLSRAESLPRLGGQDAGASAGAAAAGSTSTSGPAVSLSPTAPSAVWALLLEKYPYFSFTPSLDQTSKTFPLIGIQRSAADVASKTRTMRSGGSIKIV